MSDTEFMAKPEAVERRIGDQKAVGVVSGRGFDFWRGAIGPGQQLVEAALRMALDDASDDVGEIAERLDAAELAGLDQRSNDGPMLGATIGAGEQGILASQCQGPDAALHGLPLSLWRSREELGP